MTAGLLAGKRILVTGASSGIGRDAALLFASEGALVIASARRQAEGEQLISDIIRQAIPTSPAAQSEFIGCDISDPAQVADLFEAIDIHHGGLDGAFNNASVTQEAVALVDTSLDLYEAVYSVNVRGTWLCLQHELRIMGRQGAGAIVNTASIAGLRGYAGLSLYSSSKHAIIGLTRVAALEGAARGIRVNCICPGTTRTPMVERQMLTRSGGESATVAGIPLGRISEPREQSRAVARSLLDHASFVTGDIMVVDGGRTIA